MTTCDGEAGCACQDCRDRRHRMVYGSHPLLLAKEQEILDGAIPPEQALAFRLEEREILEAKLAVTDAEIRILRDCAQAGA